VVTTGAIRRETVTNQETKKHERHKITWYNQSGLYEKHKITLESKLGYDTKPTDNYYDVAL